MKTPPIVSQQEWEAARQQLLVKEKALTRSRDALAAERRRMPWMAVEKKSEGKWRTTRPSRSLDELHMLQDGKLNRQHIPSADGDEEVEVLGMGTLATASRA